ncbi:MAG TPA: hypothetical protein VF123_02100 [Candidatus Sulfotelmatobacter sp.]
MSGPEINQMPEGGLRQAGRFWEPGRLWYSAILFAIGLLWVVLTWPHFRAALNWADLGRMTVLGMLANVCYCAAYLAEFFIQGALPPKFWRRARYAVWIAGMLLAIVITNYWIADEIYPDFSDSGKLSAVITHSGGQGSNLNFPAPLAVVGFLSACGGLFLAASAVLIFWFARKPKFARVAGTAVGIGGLLYFGLLLGFSASSHDRALALGQEKYFCEIDCHLAYAVVDVKTEMRGDSNNYVVTLRTRFDETTISPQRPKDAPLAPSPREVRIVDSSGRAYAPVLKAGASLMTPLRPGDSYNTEMEFRIPKDAAGLRLLIQTTPAWPDRVLIGDENSWLHKKTYFAL